jgi:SprT protein
LILSRFSDLLKRMAFPHLRRIQDIQQLDLFEPIASPPPQPAPPDAKQEKDEAAKPVEQPSPGVNEELTALAKQLSRSLGLSRLAKSVHVTWNPRLKTTAGRAYRSGWMIELNPRLADISQEEIDRTFRHELAHLVSYARAGRNRIAAHGPEWRQACADLGIPGEDRCHDLPFERSRQRRKWAYECPKCGHILERVRRVKLAAACYQCCRKFNHGRFDQRFKLIEQRIVPGI